MKFIRDIIGEKRPQPRQHMGSRAGDALTEAQGEAQGEVDRAVSAPVSVPEALRLEPEHRILEEAPRERMAEAAPEGVPEDWAAGAEDDYDPAEAAHGDAFTAPLEELDEVMARCAEEAPEAEPDHVAPGDRMEDTPEAVNEAAQVVSAPLEMPAQNEPIADLSQADLSAWLAKVDTPHVFGRDDVLETAASENQEADDASATDFANSLRAVKDIMGHAKEAEAEAAVEAEAEAEVASSVEAPQVRTAQSAPVTAPTPEPEQAEEVDAPTAPVDVPTPALGRGASRPGRVKTRLLGFNPGQAAGLDPLARPKDDAQSTCASFPVGWLVVVKGPGRGAAFTLQGGVAQIGRGAGQTVRLDFGDNSISRENHAAVAYDDESQTFYIGHGGKANLVRRNGRPVLSTEELSSGDLIVIGETMLKFVPLCGPEFNWAEDGNGGRAHASLG